MPYYYNVDNSDCSTLVLNNFGWTGLNGATGPYSVGDTVRFTVDCSGEDSASLWWADDPGTPPYTNAGTFVAGQLDITITQAMCDANIGENPPIIRWQARCSKLGCPDKTSEFGMVLDCAPVVVPTLVIPDNFLVNECCEITLEGLCPAGGINPYFEESIGGGAWAQIGMGTSLDVAVDPDAQYRFCCTSNGVLAHSNIEAPNINPTANPWGMKEEQYTRNCEFTFDELNSMPGADPVYGAATLESVSEVTNNPSNGPHPKQGQFRFRAAPSHYLKDDPIIFPGQPGVSHLHLFWGNTCADAYSTALDGGPHDIIETGGSSVQGLAGANRTAYWMPALVDGPLGGPGNPRNIIVPNRMRMYYKISGDPNGVQPTPLNDVQPIPQGLQLLGGNVYVNGPMGMVHGIEITNPVGPGNGSRKLEAAMWGFYTSSIITETSDFIPASNPNGHPWIRCVIGFPFCLQTDNGTATGNPILSSANFKSHARDNLKSGGGEGSELGTPASHPYRIAHLQYLIDFACPTNDAQYQAWAAGLRLSSDFQANTAATITNQYRGQSLHGDVYFGWNDKVQQAWFDGSYKLPNGTANMKNNTNGQLGTAPHNFGRRLDTIEQNGLIGNDQTTGTQMITIPDPYDI